MRDGGRLVPDSLADAILRGSLADNPYRALLARSPRPSRRRRVVGRLRELRWRVVEAVEVLRGSRG